MVAPEYLNGYQLVMNKGCFVCQQQPDGRWIATGTKLLVNETFAEYVGTIIVFSPNVKIAPDTTCVSYYSIHRFSHTVQVKNTVDSSSDDRVWRFIA